MFANSQPVSTNQQGCHERLSQVVQRHLQHPWRTPVADHDRQAFAAATEWRQQQGWQRALMFDSGCGTGRSSVALAQQFPEALVFGLDQSEARLQRASRRFALPDNLLLVRTDCAGFWRLALDAGWRLSRHQIFYPNPWPKSAHLKRRWHGHPVWPSLLALGGELELRSNWLLYLQEMAGALAISHIDAEIQPLSPQQAVTDFEEKYQASGHALWQLRATLADLPDSE